VKRILIFLFLFFITSHAWASSLTSPQLSVTFSTNAPDTRLSTVAGTAFISFSSKNIAQFADGRTKITITDSTGKSLIGYLKAPGTGETYGPNTVLLNTTFDVNTTSWSCSNCTSATSVAGGFSNNAAQLNGPSAASQVIFQNTNATAGMLFKAFGYVKTGTSGDELTSIILKNAGAPFAILATTPVQRSSSTWVIFGTIYGTLGAGNTQIQFGFWKLTATNGTMLFDEANLVQVLTPTTDGATIVSAADGVTFNWTSETASFNRSDNFTNTIVRAFPISLN
jgi:hypothetical protein